MRVWTLAALSFVLLGIGSPAASAVAHPPKPLEDVTKLEKPTLSFSKMDPVRHNTFQIWLVDADGENERLWMETGGNASFGGGVKWSPDGKRAAMVMFDPADVSYTPYVIDLKTGQATNLKTWTPLPIELTFTQLSWSPDGRWLATAGGVGPDDDIYKLNVNARRLIRLTNMPTRHNWLPRWSPDGQKIVFRALPGTGNIDVYTIDSKDGGNRANLTQSNGFDSDNPVWSSDGRWIAFSSNRSGVPDPERWADAEIYAMRPDGSNVERLTFNQIGDFPKDWSPDGKWLVYTSFVKRGGKDVQGIYMMHIDTKEVRHVLDESILDTRWVMAGKSRFLSVDPAGKKKAQWGAVKAAGGSENNPAPQDNGEE